MGTNIRSSLGSRQLSLSLHTSDLQLRTSEAQKTFEKSKKESSRVVAYILKGVKINLKRPIEFNGTLLVPSSCWLHILCLSSCRLSMSSFTGKSSRVRLLVARVLRVFAILPLFYLASLLSGLFRVRAQLTRPLTQANSRKTRIQMQT